MNSLLGTHLQILDGARRVVAATVRRPLEPPAALHALLLLRVGGGAGLGLGVAGGGGGLHVQLEHHGAVLGVALLQHLGLGLLLPLLLCLGGLAQSLLRQPFKRKVFNVLTSWTELFAQ